MRTTIDIPEELWEKVIATSGKRTKRAAAIEAFTEYARQADIQRLLDFAGSSPDRPDYDRAEDARLYEERWARLEARRRGELD